MSKVNSCLYYGSAVQYVSRHIFLVGVLLSILSGCGGGGGGSGGDSSGNTTEIPSSNFIATPTRGVAPLIVSFDASVMPGNDNQSTSYSWNFDDGEAASEVTPRHLFNTPGNYTVTLTINDINGNSRTTSQSIIVTGDVIISNLSGTVNVAAGTLADSDVNDPNANYIANDTPDQAQLLPNPVMLGGYVNVAGTGERGRSFSSGDRSDYFRISMVANQSVTLNIADHTTGDLDLLMYYDDGDIDPSNADFISGGTGKTETLIVPEDGDYVIQVHAYHSPFYSNNGYSNYALVVGQNVQNAESRTSDRLVLADDFVPGEIIVRFNDATQALAMNQAPSIRAAHLGLEAKAGANGRAVLLTLGDVQNRQASFRALGIASDQDDKNVTQSRSADPKKQLKMDTLTVIKALRKRNDVLYAEPNYIRYPLKTATDRFYKFQWHYPLINLPAAWDVTTGASNVIVAVIDTGVLLNHPDLQGQFSADGGYDFILDDVNSQDGEPGIDDNPTDSGDSINPVIGRSSFHGTHVAGTVAATTSFSGDGVGVAGVAPGVKIMPLRVLGAQDGTLYDVIQAVRYAAGLSNDSGTVPAQKADVINLSLGGSPFSQEAEAVYQQVQEAGVVVVAAAGNENNESFFYPASYSGVISVSAVDISKQRASYSNFGSAVDVAAPGGDSSNDINGDGYNDGVLSTGGDDSRGHGDIDYNYRFLQGTSMASPHMAGVVALMKSIYSNLTPVLVNNLLGSGLIVEDLGAVGRDDQFGHGLIDARKAVDVATELAQGTPVDTSFVSVSPGALNFGTSETTLTLSIVNGGSGSLNLTTLDDNVAWLTVTSDTVDVDTNLGRYQVAVDRSDLEVGIYTANITITSSANSVTVPVIHQVGRDDLEVAAGYNYILLVDADTNQTFEQKEGRAQDGSYNYRFDDVAFSSNQSYYLFTGSDLDNDGFICDAGEACGTYISQDQPKPIGADDSHSGLNFTSGFSIGLQNQSLSGANIPAPGIAIRRLLTNP